MKNAPKTKLRDIQKAAWSKLQALVGAFQKKKTAYQEELAADLKLLYDAYGTEIVQALLARDGKLGKTESAPQAEGAADEVVEEPPRQTKSAKKGGSKRKKKELGIAELAPMVNLIIDEYNADNKRFTCRDVVDALKKKGTETDYSYITYIVRRSDKVKVVGKIPNAKGVGMPANVFQNVSVPDEEPEADAVEGGKSQAATANMTTT